MKIVHTIQDLKAELNKDIEAKNRNEQISNIKKGVEYDRAVSKEIKDYCNKKLAKYMIPKEFVVRDELPKTLVGKVNYKELEKENNK